MGEMRAEHLQYLHFFAPTVETVKSTRLRPLIQQVHVALLDRILLAYASMDVDALERNCCRYIVAARVIYSVAKVDKRAVLKALLIDDWSQIKCETYFYEKSRPVTGTKRSSHVAPPSQFRLEAAVLRKVHSGELADAEALLTPVIRPVIEGLKERLQALCPSRAIEFECDPRVGLDDLLWLKVEALLDVVSKSPKGKGVGKSGRRVDHYQQLLLQNPGPDADALAKKLCEFLQLLSNGFLPAAIVNFYSLGQGVAFCKTADPSGSVRPIVCLEADRVLLARLTKRRVDTKVAGCSTQR
jgi:hypothetical protein